MEEKKKVVRQTVYPNVWREFNHVLCDYVWFVEFKDQNMYGPFFKAHKFEGCDLVAVYDEDNEDANLYDAYGNTIYNDIHEKYDILVDDIKNVLRIGKDVALLKKEKFPEQFLRIPAVQKAIYKILDAKYVEEIKEAENNKDKDMASTLKIFYEADKYALSRVFFKIKKKDNIEKRREELQKIRLNKTTVEERTK